MKEDKIRFKEKEREMLQKIYVATKEGCPYSGWSSEYLDTYMVNGIEIQIKENDKKIAFYTRNEPNKVFSVFLGLYRKDLFFGNSLARKISKQHNTNLKNLENKKKLKDQKDRLKLIEKLLSKSNKDK